MQRSGNNARINADLTRRKVNSPRPGMIRLTEDSTIAGRLAEPAVSAPAKVCCHGQAGPAASSFPLTMSRRSVTATASSTRDEHEVFRYSRVR
jgi:hypothetical protein